MALVISERFIVGAPADRVWRYLTTPAEVVDCVPGAELTGTEEDGSFRGRVTVKVGPVTVGYTGRARFDERDDAARRVRLVADAREGSGSGTVAMTMTSSVSPYADDGSEVCIDATVELTGKIVQFGRGLIDDVSRQVIRQFVACVRSTMEPAATAVSARAESQAAAATAGAAAAAPAAPAAPAGRPRRSVNAVPLVRGAIWRMILRLFRGRRAG